MAAFVGGPQLQCGIASMASIVDVAIIGAGPYGLSLAAHLRRTGLSLRIFGHPMRAWLEMPKGMFLKSEGFASNLYDPDGSFARRANPDSITWQRLASAYWEGELRALVAAHAEATDSKWSAGLLEEWDRIAGHFWQVVPREMLTRLAMPLDDEVEAVAAE